MASGVLFKPALLGATTASGDELYWYLTGTTTDVTVYSDDLTTPHAQPVVADSDGVFPAIYLDPSDGDLKVKHTATGNGTEYSTIDPYPTDDLSTVTSDTATNTADITALDGRLTTAESEIDTLQTESTDYESRISTNESDISTLQSSALTALTATLTTTGKLELPVTGSNTLLIQWQTQSVGADSAETMTWTTAFSNACLFATACFNSELVYDDKDGSANVYSLTTTQCTVQNTASAEETIGVLSIGY